mmetsp:Transcript_14188/g.25345  ORF Transcript_14188/g.25345 Transcript_14188/m.25345 type:complete len:500 (-) Transcript_14188:36-1535(-)
MQVINGALVRIESPPLAPGSSLSKPLSGNGASSSGSLVLPEGTPVLELWTFVWNVYEDITAPLEIMEEVGTDETNTAGKKEGLTGIGSQEVAKELVSGIGDLYSNNTASDMLRTREVVSAALRLVARLLDTFPAKSKHLSPLERAVLQFMETLPPLQDSLWPIVFNVLRSFMRGDESGHRYSSGFAEKSKDLFIVLFERHAPSPARALVFEETVAEVLALATGEDQELVEQTALSSTWELASLEPIVKYGLRALSTSTWLSSRIEDVWMNLLDMLHVLLLEPTSHQVDERLRVSQQDAMVLLDGVMEEARPLVVASCVPTVVQARLFDLLRTGCTLQGDSVVETEEGQEGSAGGATRAESLLVGRACLDHLLTLLSYSTSGSSELSQQILTTVLHGVEQVVLAYFEAWGKVPQEEQNRIESDAVTMLRKLRDVEIREVPTLYLERFDRGTLQRCGTKAHLLLLWPILNRFVLVDNLEIRTALYEIMEIVGNLIVSDRYA